MSSPIPMFFAPHICVFSIMYLPIAIDIRVPTMEVMRHPESSPPESVLRTCLC